MRSLAAIGMAVVWMSACSFMGPPALSYGRPAYNEVLTRTDDEQYLSMIVRTRYTESVDLLSVASVTAGLRFSAHLGGQAPVGSSASYAGNLVPLSAGLAYEERPTISYVPLDKKTYVRQLLSPVPTEAVLLLAGLEWASNTVLSLTIGQLAGLRNPLYGTEESRRSFHRAVAMLQELQVAGVADFAELESEPGEFALILHDYRPRHVEGVRRLLQALDRAGPLPGGRAVVVPLTSTGSSARKQGAVLDTRSLVEVLEVAAACVEVPDEHHRARLSDPRLEAIVPPKGFLRIRSSEDRPDDAYVAVSHRGRWFYISADDPESKFGFRLVVSLLEMQLAESSSEKSPLLTIPVGG